MDEALCCCSGGCGGRSRLGGRSDHLWERVNVPLIPLSSALGSIANVGSSIADCLRARSSSAEYALRAAFCIMFSVVCNGGTCALVLRIVMVARREMGWWDDSLRQKRREDGEQGEDENKIVIFVREMVRTAVSGLMSSSPLVSVVNSRHIDHNELTWCARCRRQCEWVNGPVMVRSFRER